MNIFSIIILVVLSSILLIGIVFIWMVCQGFKSKDNFDELRKNREKLQW